MMGLAGVLLRQVPPDLIAGVEAKTLKVFGSVIKSVSTGNVVGHLQETSVLTQLMANGPMALPGLVGDAISVVQNEQIKTAISVVQSLQLANLAMSAASIGVSIAGTAVMLRKLAVVESKLDALEPQLARITAGVQALRRDRIAEDFSRLSTLLAQLDECWCLANPEAEWRAIARDAHFLADNFSRRAREVSSESDDPLLSIPFIDAFAIASSTRTTARLASEDSRAALEAAQTSTMNLIDLGQGIQLGSLVMSRVLAHDAEMGSPAWTQRIDETENEIRPIVTGLRDREAAAASNVLTIAHLLERGFSGREWLAVARGEHESPLLYLPEGLTTHMPRQGS